MWWTTADPPGNDVVSLKKYYFHVYFVLIMYIYVNKYIKSSKNNFNLQKKKKPKAKKMPNIKINMEEL